MGGPSIQAYTNQTRGFRLAGLQQSSFTGQLSPRLCMALPHASSHRILDFAAPPFPKLTWNLRREIRDFDHFRNFQPDVVP